MTMEYRKFNLDNPAEKERFEKLLQILMPEDVIELKILERIKFGEGSPMEAHVVYNGDTSAEQGIPEVAQR